MMVKGRTAAKPPVPTEHEEQAALFRWFHFVATAYRIPEILLAYAVPNAAKRGRKLSAYMKAEGLKAGVPDVVIPIPNHLYHGLYIEMKRIDGGQGLSEDQEHYIKNLNDLGYLAVRCNGYVEARQVVMDYLRIKERYDARLAI